MTTKTSTPAIYRADVTYTLRSQTCCNCGVLFGVEVGYDDRRRDDQQTFYCPNGHGQSYTQSRTKRELEQAKRELEASRQIAASERSRRESAQRIAEAQRRSAAAHKGWATRIRNAIAQGFCPACNTRFPDVAQHMSAEHPDFHHNVEES